MNTSATILFLKNIPLFDALTPQQISELAQVCQYEKYKKHKLIYAFDVLIEYVYIIEKGSVKLGVHSTQDKILTKDIYYENEIFGENIFGTNAKTIEFAECMEDTRAYKIPKEYIMKLVSTNGFFAQELLKIITQRMMIIEERLQQFVFKKAKERIVDFIYRTGLRKGIKIGMSECLINHGMSHREIAYLTDTSRQTVARILNELKKENFIHYSSHKSNKILIRDMETLSTFALAG